MFMGTGMEAANERRTERRLRYRWPVRFISNTGGRPVQGQVVDISSYGMAFLCHSGQKRLWLNQKVQADFGVPHFNFSDSFDTVFFSRNSRICRIDDLKNQVRRVAIQFDEPLFFKPGEQDISESDLQRRLKDKAMLIAKNDEKTRSYKEVLVGARERIRAYTEAKDEALEKLKAEIELRCRTEEALKLEKSAREKAQQKAKSEAMLRAKADKKAKAEAEKTERLKADFEQKIKMYEETIANIKPGFNVEAEVGNRPIIEINEKVKPQTKGVLKKVGGFIKDRDRIY